MKRFTVLFLFILSVNCLLAQNGIVSGKVIDETSGETLIGVNVLVKSSGKGIATDLDGAFKLTLPAGTYDLQISYLSYQSKLISGVSVKSGDITSLTITLTKLNKELNAVVIEAKADRETQSALVIEQKNSVVVFDGISGDQIRKMPDRNTADVLKRVSGATIQDNSFVIIRGLPDRYNAAFINGAPLPSSEPDRKAFAFDIFPSALISDLKVIKTAMPSLSGEFAGGIIQIRTKDIPDKNYYSISLGTNMNAITTFSDFGKGQGGKLDFTGFDDGTRKLPQGFPSNEQLVSTQNNFQYTKLGEYAGLLNNNFKVSNRMALPGLNFQFSMGHNANLIKKANRDKSTSRKEFGSVFAISYNNSPSFRDVRRYDYTPADTTRIIDYRDKQYNTNISWGAVWNMALVLSKANGANNRLSLKTIYNVNSNDQYIERTGFDGTGTSIDQGFEVKSYNMLYTQNNMISSQLNGEHSLPKSKVKFDWGGGLTRLDRIIPDYRILDYRRAVGDTTLPFFVNFPASPATNVASRFYSNQRDYIYSGNFDVSKPFRIKKSQHEIKAGAYLQYKTRDFSARQLGYTNPLNNNVYNIGTSPIDSVFIPAHLGPNAIVIQENTRKSDTYLYAASLIAGYIQFENTIPIPALYKQMSLKFLWGARVESFRQKLNTFAFADGSPINLDNTVVDVLPSLNIIYNFHPKMNLRLSASQTVARPESRELAPFTFYDYSNFALVGGRSALVRTKVTNADLRYEWYPNGGQVISVTGFFKHFSNPIEKILSAGATNRTFSYANVPSAITGGAELEFKFSFGSLFKSKSRFLNDFSIVGNLAYIYSRVNVVDSLTGTNEKRPLQGQSPFIINTSLQYADSKYDFGISLAFNYIGRRIWLVGNEYNPTIWENPRPVLDLQLTKSFLKKRMEIRLNMRDLIAYKAIFYQDMNDNGKFDSKDYIMINQRLGQQFSLSLGYKF